MELRDALDIIVGGVLAATAVIAIFILLALSHQNHLVHLPNGDAVKASVVQNISSYEVSPEAGYVVLVVWSGVHTEVKNGLSQQQAKEMVAEITSEVESKLK